MDFEKLCAERYSLRKYADLPVEAEKLEKVLEAGHNAPTAHNLQPQRILVMQSREALEKAEECTACKFHAPVILVVAYDPAKAWNREGDMKNHGEIDATIAATQMMLQAANDRKRQRPESVPVKISRSSPFRARRQPSPSARRRPGPCNASLTRIVTGICTRPSTTLPKSNTRRRTSSPVRGSTRSSTKEVSSMAAKKRRRKRKKKIEASKKLAYWAASVATLSAASSLLLSAFGRDPVGELTGTIFTACVGYLITYAGKSLGEKISRNRHGLDADGNPLPDPSGDTLNNEEAKG